MSTPKLISPLLDNFLMGDPITDRDGVRCCPAVNQQTQEKFIVKIISIPATQTKLDALLLTGAYPDAQAAAAYFLEQANEITAEVAELNLLSKSGGFDTIAGCQIEAMDDGTGYDVYLLCPYKKALDKHFAENPATHLDSSNLTLDICAALATCRNAGYIYLDLKPSNIYISPEKGYRIGDLGLMRLSSLKYAAIPQRYIGPYSAPELKDAFSQPNETVDTYALGMILYEIYNGGILPTVDAEQDDVLPAPQYANEEIAQIILKACHPDPAQRWQTPAQMGQALVAYIQKNGLNDERIVPEIIIHEAIPESEVNEDAASDSLPVVEETEVESVIEDIPEETTSAGTTAETEESVAAEEPAESISEETEASKEAPSETNEAEYDNLTFFNVDEPTEEEPIKDEYEFTDDIEDVLSKADEVLQSLESDVDGADEFTAENADALVEEEVAEDVILSSVVEMAEEETICESEESNELESIDSDEAEQSDDIVSLPIDEAEESTAEKKKRSKSWIGWILAAVLLCGLLVGGYFFYTNYYLQPVNSFAVTGAKDTMTIHVDCPLDSQELCIVLTDKFGEEIIVPLSSGTASVSGLQPDMTYTVEVTATGFHKLTGKTETTYSTQKLTEVLNFTVVTGNADGTAELSFQVTGPDSQKWTAVFQAENNSELNVPVENHRATVKDLSLGTTYTVKLQPETELFLAGTTQTEYTASTVLLADKLTVSVFQDGKLTASWIAPLDESVTGWTVVCESDTGEQQVANVETTEATFENIDHAQAYTVTVTAAGQSVSAKAVVNANAQTLTNLTASSTSAGTATVSWDAPEGQWNVEFLLVGTSLSSSHSSNGKSITVTGLIPRQTYEITVKDANGVAAAHPYTFITISEGGDFSGYTVSRWNMQFRMCKTPAKANWTKSDVKDADFTTSFAKGQKASFLIRLNKTYNTSPDNIVSLFVIRDADGNVVHTATTNSSWTNMWYQGYCELDVPGVETLNAGSYKIDIYFNGATAFTGDFTVTE